MDSIRSIRVLKVLLRDGQLAMWRMDSKVMPQSLHLEQELEGMRDLVARALWRMFLNHEWMSLLVVRGECISLARSVQGMMLRATGECLGPVIASQSSNCSAALREANQLSAMGRGAYLMISFCPMQNGPV